MRTTLLTVICFALSYQLDEFDSAPTSRVERFDVDGKEFFILPVHTRSGHGPFYDVQLSQQAQVTSCHVTGSSHFVLLNYNQVGAANVTHCYEKKQLPKTPRSSDALIGFSLDAEVDAVQWIEFEIVETPGRVPPISPARRKKKRIETKNVKVVVQPVGPEFDVELIARRSFNVVCDENVENVTLQVSDLVNVTMGKDFEEGMRKDVNESLLNIHGFPQPIVNQLDDLFSVPSFQISTTSNSVRVSNQSNRSVQSRAFYTAQLNDTLTIACYGDRDEDQVTVQFKLGTVSAETTLKFIRPMPNVPVIMVPFNRSTNGTTARVLMSHPALKGCSSGCGIAIVGLSGAGVWQYRAKEFWKRFPASVLETMENQSLCLLPDGQCPQNSSIQPQQNEAHLIQQLLLPNDTAIAYSVSEEISVDRSASILYRLWNTSDYGGLYSLRNVSAGGNLACVKPVFEGCDGVVDSGLILNACGVCSNETTVCTSETNQSFTTPITPAYLNECTLDIRPFVWDSGGDNFTIATNCSLESCEVRAVEGAKSYPVDLLIRNATANQYIFPVPQPLPEGSYFVECTAEPHGSRITSKTTIYTFDFKETQLESLKPASLRKEDGVHNVEILGSFPFNAGSTVGVCLLLRSGGGDSAPFFVQAFDGRKHYYCTIDTGTLDEGIYQLYPVSDVRIVKRMMPVLKPMELEILGEFRTKMAVFDSSLVKILVQFSDEVQTIENPKSCGLFEVTTIQLLGDSPTCMISSNYLHIITGSNAKIVPGDFLHFRSNIVSSLRTGAFLAESEIIVGRPAVEVIPVVLLEGPTVASKCPSHVVTLTASFTGFGSRPVEYQWRCENCPKKSPDDGHASPGRLSYDVLPWDLIDNDQKKIDISLIACNFLGNCSERVFHSIKIDEALSHTLQITGVPSTCIAGSRLKVYAEYVQCQRSTVTSYQGKSVAYHWYLVSGLNEVTGDSQVWTIPQNVLEGGTNATLHATLETVEKILATASLSFFVSEPKPVLAFPVDYQIVGSRDAQVELPEPRVVGIDPSTFQWSCRFRHNEVPALTTSYLVDALVKIDNASDPLTLSHVDLGRNDPSEGQQWTNCDRFLVNDTGKMKIRRQLDFSVQEYNITISAPLEDLSSTTTIKILNQPLPFIEARLDAPRKIDPLGPLIVDARISSDIDERGVINVKLVDSPGYKWMEWPKSLFHLTETSLNLTKGLLHSRVAIPRVGARFPDWLGFEPDTRYRLEVSVTVASGMALDFIDFLTNAPPLMGSVKMTTTDPVALESPISLESTGEWVDSASDFPLTYQFGYGFEGPGSRVEWLPVSYRAAAVVVLPSGSPSESECGRFGFKGYLRVCDNLGCCSQVETATFNVEQPANITEAVEKTLKIASDDTVSGNTFDAYQKTSAAMAQLCYKLSPSSADETVNIGSAIVSRSAASRDTVDAISDLACGSSIILSQPESSLNSQQLSTMVNGIRNVENLLTLPASRRKRQIAVGQMDLDVNEAQVLLAAYEVVLLHERNAKEFLGRNVPGILGGLCRHYNAAGRSAFAESQSVSQQVVSLLVLTFNPTFDDQIQCTKCGTMADVTFSLPPETRNSFSRYPCSPNEDCLNVCAGLVYVNIENGPTKSHLVSKASERERLKTGLFKLELRSTVTGAEIDFKKVGVRERFVAVLPLSDGAKTARCAVRSDEKSSWELDLCNSAISTGKVECSCSKMGYVGAFAEPSAVSEKINIEYTLTKESIAPLGAVLELERSRWTKLLEIADKRIGIVRLTGERISLDIHAPFKEDASTVDQTETFDLVHQLLESENGIPDLRNVTVRRVEDEYLPLFVRPDANAREVRFSLQIAEPSKPLDEQVSKMGLSRFLKEQVAWNIPMESGRIVNFNCTVDSKDSSIRLVFDITQPHPNSFAPQPPEPLISAALAAFRLENKIQRDDAIFIDQFGSGFTVDKDTVRTRPIVKLDPKPRKDLPIIIGSLVALCFLTSIAIITVMVVRKVRAAKISNQSSPSPDESPPDSADNMFAPRNRARKPLT